MVETQSGNKYISNVFFVFEANQNLLSVGQLSQSHYALLFKDKSCIIFNPKGEEVLTVKMRNKCFPIDCKHAEHKAYFNAINESELWHRRLSYVDNNSLQNMASHQLVEGLPKITKPK
ncbi:Uncharacterized protein TCM_021747 [Theobroma cacao]|uniref:GAG-pre-integrase domain-containing protein n=1 Tax=Theobroma cacao TaxID=3641 RepID=A0A061EYE4_THECC|nr:Uncharacterized protein TCM_021747 [Theobroma cacao]